ncbi:MAG: hypothetical protein E7040_01465 [Lentisphaerae bacterium]|nr:hypothetical protein [Lentisphaerota bacterium]
MKYILKLVLIIISFTFCLETTANNIPQKTVPDKVFTPLTIPEEVWTKIPEDIDFIGHADGTRLPILLMKRKIKQELKKYDFLRGLKYYEIANKYYLFGSAKHGYCGLLIHSSNLEAQKIFHVLTTRIKTKHDIKINGRYAVWAKEKLVFYLYSENLLLISFGEKDLKKFTAEKPSPIFKELSSTHIASAYCKSNLVKIPLIRDYVLTIPELYEFKEARMFFQLLPFSVNSEFVFSSQKKAENISSAFENIIKEIAVKYPDFPSAINRSICKETIKLSVSTEFFSAVKKIAKDPELRKLFQNKITIKNR